jgi:glycosyltransferase involved in cell wall biosynthesis
MERVKDPLNLARAFVRASERCDRARLVLVGDGALRADLENVFKAAGLLGRVWFAGERKDVADILRGLDCFALPSLAEGISNTILEAMATRLPVVATRVGGNPELIESGMTGVLVPPANSDALADALLHYFNHRATARRHAKAARQLVENRFSLSRMVHDYSRLYERTLGAAGVPLPGAQALAPR